MKNILVPIGSNDNAHHTLQYAIDLAEAIEAKVYVFRAYSVVSKAGTIINMNSIVERETNLYMRTIIKMVDTKGVEVKMIAAKGNVIDSLVAVDDELDIDLIVMSPKSNAINEEVFLGSTSGSIVKHTHIPTLIVPEGNTFKPFGTILTAFKSGIISNPNKLRSLRYFGERFGAKINLLLVKTPSYTDADGEIAPELKALQNTLTVTQNATTYQGVLEHFQSNNPDLLCVFRRKRGFFQKLWEKNTILKSEFYCSIPLLVLG